MATSTRSKAKAAKAEEVEPEYAFYLDKDPTAVHEACQEYIAEKTGYDADLRTVQLVLVLYGKFQKSPENQRRIQEQKESAAAAAEERANKPAKATKKSAAPTRRRAAAVEDEDVEEEAPKRRGRGATAVSGAKKASAPVRGRRRPAPAEDDEDFDA